MSLQESDPLPAEPVAAAAAPAGATTTPVVAPVSSRSRRRLRPSFAAGAGLVTVVLVAVPLLVLLWSSFTVSPLGLPFTSNSHLALDNYIHVFTDRTLVRPIVNTIVFVVGSLAIGLLISLGLAVLLERTNLPMRGLFFALIVAPVAMPQVVAGIAWGLLLDPQVGLVNKMLQWLPGINGPGPLNSSSLLSITAVQGFLLVPFSLLLVAPVVRSTSGALEEAAHMTGAGRRARMVEIVLPLMAPGLASVLIYQFVTAAQAFDIPAVLGLESGTKVFSTAIYKQLNTTTGLPHYGVANAMSVLLLVFALIPMYWYYRMIGRSERYAVITGKSYRRRTIQLPGVWRPVALLVVLGYVLAVVVLPLFILLWMSTQPFYSTPSFSGLQHATFEAYRRVFTVSTFKSTLRNTLILGVVAATVACTLATLNSWLLLRRRGLLGKVADVFAFITHGIPGVVLGVSLLFSSLYLGSHTRIHLFGTMTLLVIGMVIVTLGVTTRITTAGIGQIHRNLEDAAEMCGAGFLSRVLRITVPLAAPSVANAWVLAFAYALSNLTLTVVLAGSANRTVAVELYTRWNFGDVQTAAALGLLLTVISVTATVLARSYAARKEARH
ncbi:MAG: iron(III) transport system permease protein [Pseudonocardiales bacterium]|jgi:iron(III) transport system permease protein|nr:binding-protein-dependent transport system inner rane protein [Pseudonocardiales bacterium]MDT4962087.1 iron(III) transport system permease protein [Pseudonocardiales bacterium]